MDSDAVSRRLLQRQRTHAETHRERILGSKNELVKAGNVCSAAHPGGDEVPALMVVGFDHLPFKTGSKHALEASSLANTYHAFGKQ